MRAGSCIERGGRPRERPPPCPPAGGCRSPKATTRIPGAESARQVPPSGQPADGEARRGRHRHALDHGRQRAERRAGGRAAAQLLALRLRHVVACSCGPQASDDVTRAHRTLESSGGARIVTSATTTADSRVRRTVFYRRRRTNRRRSGSSSWTTTGTRRTAWRCWSACGGTASRCATTARRLEAVGQVGHPPRTLSPGRSPLQRRVSNPQGRRGPQDQ